MRKTKSYKWFNVNDKLPDNYDSVLIAIEGPDGYGGTERYVSTGRYEYFSTSGWIKDNGELGELEKVFAWLPFPEVPTE